MNYPDEVTDAIEYWHCDNPEDSLEEIFSLFSRFGDSVLRGAKSMQNKHDNLCIPTSEDSFLAMLSSKDYLKTPIRIRVEEIDSILNESIPQAFHTDKPKNENDFNDITQALLTAAKHTFTREYPVLRFGLTSYRADLAEDCLIIESKYLRNNTTPSTATESISADITKVQDGFSILFVVYDPYRKIQSDNTFISAFEGKRQSCYIRIYR